MCIFPATPLIDVTFVPFCSNTVTVHWGVEDRSICLFLYSTTYLIMPNNEHLAKIMATQISLPNLFLYTECWTAMVREGWNCLCSLAPCHENTRLTCTKEVSGLNPSYPYCKFCQQYFKRRVGTWWHSWVRHCTKSQKVAGSIPDGVIGIFHWHNPSGRTMAQGPTHPLTEMSTRNISWGVKWSVRTADNLTTFMCWLSWNPGALTSWNPYGLSRPVMGLLNL